ncbi:MAG: cytochrome c [Bacteroidota bacterium]
MQKFLFIFGLFSLLMGFSSFDNDELDASKARGEEVYMDYCIACHMTTGEGVEGVFPPLANSDYLLADVERAIRVVKYGQMGPITVNEVEYNSAMPSPGLDDDEIADVLTFVLNAWGNDYGKLVTEEQVAAVEE